MFFGYKFRVSLINKLETVLPLLLSYQFWWGEGGVKVFNTILKNISVISCCIEYTSSWVVLELTTLVVIGTECIGSCESNYHTIMTTMVLSVVVISQHLMIYTIQQSPFNKVPPTICHPHYHAMFQMHWDNKIVVNWPSQKRPPPLIRGGPVSIRRRSPIKVQFLNFQFLNEFPINFLTSSYTVRGHNYSQHPNFFLCFM